MVEIYTSYLAKAKSAVNPICIAYKRPHFWAGPIYTKLGPDEKLLRMYKAGTVTVRGYTRQFVAMLDKLDADIVVQDLCRLAGSETFTLVCYEKPGAFCHRHLVARWLARYGYNVHKEAGCEHSLG